MSNGLSDAIGSRYDLDDGFLLIVMISSLLLSSLISIVFVRSHLNHPWGWVCVAKAREEVEEEEEEEEAEFRGKVEC